MLDNQVNLGSGLLDFISWVKKTSIIPSITQPVQNVLAQHLFIQVEWIKSFCIHKGFCGYLMGKNAVHGTCSFSLCYIFFFMRRMSLKVNPSQSLSKTAQIKIDTSVLFRFLLIKEANQNLYSRISWNINFTSLNKTSKLKQRSFQSHICMYRYVYNLHL